MKHALAHRHALSRYFDVRKEARTSEIDALGKAKAVLSGADYSFVQTGASRRCSVPKGSLS